MYPYKRVKLFTSCSVLEELIASLSYFAESREACVKLIESRFPANRASVSAARLVQAFLRQGKTFLTQASELHFRSSPLLYYYAFLNFAKAQIALRSTQVVSGRIGHGLRHIHSDGDFSSQFVTVASGGVFPELYRTLLGEEVTPLTEFRIVEALSYCTDVSYELSLTRFSARKIIPVKSLLCKAESQSWVLLAVNAPVDQMAMQPLMSGIEGYFSPVSLDLQEAARIFEIDIRHIRGYLFLESSSKLDEEPQSGRIEGRELAKLCLDPVARFIEPSVSAEEFATFQFRLPTESGPMLSEQLSIFLVMYYLSSLVRYFPAYLEDVLIGEDAWLVERFVRGVSATYLKHVLSDFRGECISFVAK